MENEIVVAGASDMFMPVMTIKQAISRRGALVEFREVAMIEGHDFGKIPGAGDKPTLLKPGAEKLVTFFGLSPVFVSERVTENFGDDGTEPLFFYRYRCELYRNGSLVGSGIGSCNSRESKYRYRNEARKCPHCGQPAIIKGKQEYGGGWLCFKNKNGCGAKFKDGDMSIEGQVTGKVANIDVADQVNTIDKMAQKRSLIAATLIAVNASEFFTQDVEDMQFVDSTASVVTVVTQSSAGGATPAIVVADDNRQPANGGSNGNGNTDKKLGQVSDKTLKHLHAVGVSLYGDEWDERRHKIVKATTKGRTESSKELWEAEANFLISGIEERLLAQVAAVKVDAVPELVS